MNQSTVLHWVLAQIVQIVMPVGRFFQDIRHGFRYQDVTAIAAVHDALSEVDAHPGNVLLTIDVGNSGNGALMYSNSELYTGILTESTLNVRGAADGGRQILKKYQSHTVTCRQTKQQVGCMSLFVLGCFNNNSAEHSKNLRLLLRRMCGVGHDVHEDNSGHLGSILCRVLSKRHGGRQDSAMCECPSGYSRT